MERHGDREADLLGSTAARVAREHPSQEGEREQDATGAGRAAQLPARPHETGPTPTVTAFDDAESEAAGIARWIADRHVGRVRWDSFGVLARTNAQLGDIAEALDDRGIPCLISGQRSPFVQLPAVQQLLKHLSTADAHFATVVEDLRADALDASALDASALDSGALDSGALEPGAPVALEPVTMRVLDLADAYLAEMSRTSGRQSRHSGPTGEGFATWVRLLSGSDRELTGDLFDSHRSGTPFDQRDGAVALATFHAAKGLQWRHVVIAGVEDGLVPLRHDDPEERRLFYVAVSRATRTLHLTWARHRAGRATAGGPRSPSPWLTLIAAATAEPSALSPHDAASRVAAARAALDANRDR